MTLFASHPPVDRTRSGRETAHEKSTGARQRAVPGRGSARWREAARGAGLSHARRRGFAQPQPVPREMSFVVVFRQRHTEHGTFCQRVGSLIRVTGDGCRVGARAVPDTQTSNTPELGVALGWVRSWVPRAYPCQCCVIRQYWVWPWEGRSPRWAAHMRRCDANFSEWGIETAISKLS